MGRKRKPRTDPDDGFDDLNAAQIVAARTKYLRPYMDDSARLATAWLIRKEYRYRINSIILMMRKKARAESGWQFRSIGAHGEGSRKKNVPLPTSRHGSKPRGWLRLVQAIGEDADHSEMLTSNRNREIDHTLKIQLQEGLRELDGRERTILLRAMEGETLAAIARSLKLTRERVRQIITKTRTFLTNYL